MPLESAFEVCMVLPETVTSFDPDIMLIPEAATPEVVIVFETKSILDDERTKIPFEEYPLVPI